MPARTKGTEDKPFRAPEGTTAEDDRAAMNRLNRRLEAALRRIEHLEQIIKDEGLWVNP